MTSPLQPYYKIRVYKAGVTPSNGDSYKSRGGSYRSNDSYDFMDVEECTAPGVVYEEEASLLNTLTFTINKHADVLLHRFRLGQWIVLYGGYYSEDGNGIRKVFSGTVTRIRTQLPDSGVAAFTVECMSYGFTQLGKDSNFYVYPDKNSSRPFAKGKTSLTLKSLVEGIIKDSGLQIGEITLSKEAASVNFTEKNLRRQKNISDWKFLHELARSYSCFLWTEFSAGREFVYFVDKSKAVKKSSGGISFVYPLHGKEGIKNLETDEIQRFSDSSWNRPRIIRDVVIDEDISLAYAVSRSAMYYDKDTGEEKEALAQILTDKEGRKVMVMYELDEGKVQEVERTNPYLADQIRSLGGAPKGWSSGVEDPSKETPEYTRYYYKEVKRYDNSDVAVYDQAFFGIYITATCNQDLDIRSQKSYPIRGIVRYSSSDKVGNYFLRGLKHVWDDTGATTQLDFIK